MKPMRIRKYGIESVVLSHPISFNLHSGPDRSVNTGLTVFVIGLLSAVTILFAGCTAATATHDKPDLYFGRSLKAAFFTQVLHPEGPSDPSPADTLPGDLADQIYKKRYFKSMTEEKKENESTAGHVKVLQ